VPAISGADAPALCADPGRSSELQLNIATPALGPSFGVAPAGTWT
jgi:hypothetical protein